MTGTVWLGAAGEPGQVISLDHHGELSQHRRRAPGRPARRRRGVLVVGAPQPAECLLVEVPGPGQRDPQVGRADVPGHEQAPTGLAVVQPQAEVHLVLGGRLHHGEGAARTDQADHRLAGLHRHLAKRGQHRQHGVEHQAQLRAVGVLGVDQFVRAERCLARGCRVCRCRVGRRQVADGRTGAGSRGLGAAPFRRCLEPGPVREAVVPGNGELSGRKRDLVRDLAEPPQCACIAADCGAVQFAGLTAELIGVRAVGKLGHDASPHRVRGPRSGSPEDGRAYRSEIQAMNGGGLSPSRRPGGALPRHRQRIATAGREPWPA